MSPSSTGRREIYSLRPRSACRRARRVLRGVAGEHHDRPRLLAPHHDEVLEHVARRRLGVDDDYVGLHALDVREQRERGLARDHDLVARFL
jgi:hypothetical protein